MDKKFKQIYYSDDGYWRGKVAINKLSIEHQAQRKKRQKNV